MPPPVTRSNASLTYPVGGEMASPLPLFDGHLPGSAPQKCESGVSGHTVFSSTMAVGLRPKLNTYSVSFPSTALPQGIVRPPPEYTVGALSSAGYRVMEGPCSPS